MREIYDTNIPWIGKIPVEWKFTKLGRLTCIITDGTHQTPNYIDSGYPFLSIKDISSGKIDFSDVKYISEEEHKSLYQHAPVKRGDFLFTRIGTLGVFVEVDTDEVFDFFVSVGMLRLKENVINHHFLLHYLNSPAVGNFIQAIKAGFGTAAPKYNLADVKRTWIIVPPAQEQKKIADFLDVKCAEIDALSAEIQSEIDMLEAYKRSVITEAVTKGLDKNVPMKDSGIEWVGEVPAAWDIHPVYVYFGERKNKNYALKEQNLLSLSYGKIIRKDIDTVGGLLPASFNTYNIVEVGDIIIRPTDLQNDKRSLRTGLVVEKGIITSAYIDLAPKGNINSAYFHYLLHSYDVQKVFYNMGNGVRQGLNYSEFSKLMVFAPSHNEQNAIVAYLNDKCAEIETVISQKQEQLTLLADYKKSVIYEYVTGKKEVPA